MNIYLIEENNNKELYSFLNKKYKLVKTQEISKACVVIVNRVFNVKQALDIVDFALNSGIEVICIKNKFAKEHYVCNHLIKEGAKFV